MPISAAEHRQALAGSADAAPDGVCRDPLKRPQLTSANGLSASTLDTQKRFCCSRTMKQSASTAQRRTTAGTRGRTQAKERRG